MIPKSANMQHGEFHKMHGLGNDFVIIDARDAPVEMTETKAAAIADRHHGIGCDQLILLLPSATADVRMVIYNNDGGEVEACGNATRCVVTLLGCDVDIETTGGLLQGSLAGDSTASVDMGTPHFSWDKIPLAYAVDASNLPVSWEELRSPICVNVGNPHVIFFVSSLDDIELGRLGPIIENDALFPDRVNVNVAEISGDEINLRVWERGAGLTQACGTGACATAVAAISRKLVTGPVRVNLPGGTLTINWSAGEHIQMTGPTTHVFTGHADWSQFG